MKVIFEKEINTADIVISPRPIWKCRSCHDYGKTLSCPPHVPSWKEAREWIDRFSKANFYKFKIEPGNYRDEKREVLYYLLNKEKELFKANKVYACALFPGSCNLCDECSFATLGSCLQPHMVRPSVDAIGIEMTGLTAINFNESVLYSLVLID